MKESNRKLRWQEPFLRNKSDFNPFFSFENQKVEYFVFSRKL